MRRYFMLKITICALFFILCPSVTGISATECDEPQADNITGLSQLSVSGFNLPRVLTDQDTGTYTAATSEGNIAIFNEEGIGSIYLIFDRIPPAWQVTDIETGRTIDFEQAGFLHTYVDLEESFGYIPLHLSIQFSAGVSIAEIYVFSEGNAPEWVQKWLPPCSSADLLLLSSHADDEQLFFAGILPYYAGELGYQVQVIYLTSHFFNTHIRPHEQLDGLWAVGVRNYPIISDFPDLYSESMEEALEQYERYGYQYTDFVAFITENLRRFKPLVVVSHDIKGEYGHGTHMLCTEALRESLQLCLDPKAYEASADKYGTWEPKKTYLHLYPENKIVMDWDIPLDKFGGKTAFQMSQEGFSYHTSQHWTWFNKWLNGTQANPVRKAAEISVYSPCLYGLYQTTVGYDRYGGDFFENIDLHISNETEIFSDTISVSESVPEPDTSQTEACSEMTLNEQNEKSNSYLFVIALPIVALIITLVLVFLAVRQKKREQYL